MCSPIFGAIPGMTIIEIEPQHRDTDVAAEVLRALKVLDRAGVRARRRVRSLETRGLVQVPDPDAERSIHLLRAKNMRAAIRPS
jgi:hypothetical protein